LPSRSGSSRRWDNNKRLTRRCRVRPSSSRRGYMKLRRRRVLWGATRSARAACDDQNGSGSGLWTSRCGRASRLPTAGPGHRRIASAPPDIPLRTLAKSRQLWCPCVPR
jgi:hypothetical protein